MNTRTGWTLVVVASLLGVGAAAATSSAWWPSTSPDHPPSATASTPSVSTSSPSASPPSQTVPSPVSSTTPAPKGSSPESTPGLKPVAMVTTFAGWNATSGAVEVGGYATVVEPVGTCTLRLTHGDKVVTREQTASADATTVACGGFSVPRSELTAGGWQAVLSYTSSRSKGQTAAVTVKVP